MGLSEANSRKAIIRYVGKQIVITVILEQGLCGGVTEVSKVSSTRV